jgi:hypothetical protein
MTCPTHRIEYDEGECCPLCLADYEADGEADGCYHCGSSQHHSSDCHA